MNDITTNGQRVDLSDFSARVAELRRTISTVIVGQQTNVELVLTAILADGHVLLEGVPGVAKTLLARTISRLIGARFQRIQFTPDLMPSDVIGTTVVNAKTAEFSFRPGPVFSDIVLVDEINRSPAKTQAALFEVMEERQVTVDGTSHPMGRLYTILATQNPVEQEGTYQLPEAQLDRFMMKVIMGYPELDDEVNILRRHQANARLTKLEDLQPVLSQDELLAMRDKLQLIVVDDSLLRYIAQVVESTRSSRAIQLGASPRAAVALLQAGKAFAMLQGRDFVVPDDIKTLAQPVLCHRIILTAEAEMQGYTPARVIDNLIEKVEVPK